MRGYVENVRPWLHVPLLVQGQRLVVGFQVDTAFGGCLSLPPATIAKLGLPLRGNVDLVLADGSRLSKPVYSAKIEWFGIPTVVTVVPLGVNPLIGAYLLDGCELNVRYVESGEVRLSPL